jgi:outer membrane lipoprotein SlyB
MGVNEGKVDRIIRVVLGLVLGYLAFQGVGGGVGTWIFGVLGAVAFLTGVSGFCGLYRLVGIRTCPVATAPPKAR